MDATNFTNRSKHLESYELVIVTEQDQIANVETIPISSKEEDTTQISMNGDTEMLTDENEEYESKSQTPTSQWSLLNKAPIESGKRLLHSMGLYSPGSNDLGDKYTCVSNSDALLHPMYPLVKVEDPGIRKVLHEKEDDKYFPEDGQQLYLELCEEIEIVPVRRFYDGLLKAKIDVTYCGVNPVGVRAMCLALNCNMIVEEFDLADNFLTLDACYHIGCMLRDNRNLTSLNLTGCRIGPEGVRRVCRNLINNSLLQSLNLTYNNLGDDGTIIFCELLQGNTTLTRLNLSHNKIGAKSVIELANCLECGNSITHFNIAWNHLFSPHATRILIKVLADSSCLQEVDLSWNCIGGARVGSGIRDLLQVPTLAVLNLSHNRLQGEALQAISTSLHKVRKMDTLNLSFNPISDADVLNILTEFSNNRVRIQNLFFDNIWVKPDFVRLLNSLKAQSRYGDLVVTYEGVSSDYNIKNADMRKIVMKRAKFLNPEGAYKTDFGQFIMILQNESNRISVEEFTNRVDTDRIDLDANLIGEIANAFPGPRTEKEQLIDLKGMVDYIKRLWPSTSLPAEATRPSTLSKATRKSVDMKGLKIKKK